MFKKRGFTPIVTLLVLGLILVAVAAAVFLTGVGPQLFSKAYNPGYAQGQITAGTRVCRVDADCQKLKQICQSTGRCDPNQQGTSCVNNMCSLEGANNAKEDSQVKDIQVRVVPALASTLGRFNLHIEWDKPFGNGQNFSNFELRLGNAGKNSLLPGAPANNMGKDTQTDFNGLTLSNGNYTVTIIAYDANRKVLTSGIAEFGLFEEGFNRLTNDWTISTDAHATATVENGKLNLRVAGATADGGAAAKLNKNLTKDFDSSVEFDSFTAPAVDFGFVGLKYFGGSEQNSTAILRGSAPGCGSMRWWANGTQLAQISFPTGMPCLTSGKLKLSRLGTRIIEAYDVGHGWSVLTPTSSAVVTGSVQPQLNVWTQGSHPDVSATLDNYRLIWVK